MSYSVWQKSSEQARNAATKVSTKGFFKRGVAKVAKGGKKVIKRVPIVGLIFLYSDIQDKGFINGVCNNLLDACPYLRWGKLSAECIWGDWFPDNEDHRDD